MGPLSEAVASGLRRFEVANGNVSLAAGRRLAAGAHSQSEHTHTGSTAPQKLDVQSAIADTTDTFTLAALPSSWSGSHMLLHASLVTHPTTIDMVILHRLSSSPLLSHRSTHHGIWPAHTMLSSSHSYSTYNSNKVTRNDSGKAPKYDSSKPPKYDNSKRTSASQGPTHDNTQPMRPTHHQQRHQAQQRDRNQGSSRPTIAPNTLTVAASSSRAMRAAMGLGSGSREPQAAVVLAGVVEPEELTVSRFRNPVGLADLKDLIANHFKDMQPKHLCAAVRAIVDLKTDRNQAGAMNSSEVALLDLLADRLESKIQRCEPRQLVNLAWCFAKLGYWEPLLVEVLVELRKEEAGKLWEAGAQGYANVAWALARARERSFRSPVAKQIVSSHASPLLAHIADFSLQANENNPAPPPTHTATHESRSRDEYGSTDHGSRSEQEPEASPAMSLRKDAGFTVECVASLLHSCGVLRRSKPDSQLLDALILEAVAGVGAGRMKASDLSRCMWALTRLDLPDMAFLKIVTRAVVMDGAMKGGKAQEWSTLAWAFAQLGCRSVAFSTTVCEAVLGTKSSGGRNGGASTSAVSSVMQGATPSDWSSVCWALATLRHRDAGVLEAAERHFVLNMFSYKSQELVQLLWSFAMLSYTPSCVARLVEQLQGLLPTDHTSPTPAQLASSNSSSRRSRLSNSDSTPEPTVSKQQPLEWPDVCTALWSLSSLDLLDVDPQLTHTLVHALNCAAAGEKGIAARPNFSALIRRLEPFQQQQLLQVVDALAVHGWVPVDASSPQLSSASPTMTHHLSSGSPAPESSTAPSSLSRLANFEKTVVLSVAAETAAVATQTAAVAVGSALSVHPELLAALWATQWTERGEEASRRRNSNDGEGDQSGSDVSEAGRAEEEQAAAAAVAQDLGRVLGWMIKQQDAVPGAELELTRVMMGRKALDSGTGVGMKAGIQSVAPLLLSMGKQGVAQSTAVLTLSDGSNVVLLVDGADLAMRNLDENPEVVDGIGSLRDLILTQRFGADYVVTLLPEQLLEQGSVADKAYLVQQALGL